MGACRTSNDRAAIEVRALDHDGLPTSVRRAESGTGGRCEAEPSTERHALPRTRVVVPPREPDSARVERHGRIAREASTPTTSWPRRQVAREPSLAAAEVERAPARRAARSRGRGRGGTASSRRGRARAPTRPRRRVLLPRLPQLVHGPDCRDARMAGAPGDRGLRPLARARRLPRRRRRAGRAARARLEGRRLPRAGRRHRGAAARLSRRTAASRISSSPTGSSACGSIRATGGSGA